MRLGLRRADLLTSTALALGAAVLSAGVFAAFFAPGWPRTAWGWLISVLLGLPLLVFAEVVWAFAMVVGTRGMHRYSRWDRVPRGERAVRATVFVVRVLAAAAIFGSVLWLIHHFFLGAAPIRAQFR